MHRQIAGKLTGKVTKWIVFAAWIIVFVVASGFAAKLTDVQNNEASSWLPASAESTEVLDELSTAVDPNDIPTLVVYDRSSGLTQDDLAAMDEQAAEIAKIDGVTSAGVLSPNVAQQQDLPVQLLSEDGEVGYLYFVFNFGENGWTDIPPRPTRSATSPRSTASPCTWPATAVRRPTPPRPSRASTPT